MHAKTLLASILLLTTALAGCIVPENMQTLREDLGYASHDTTLIVAIHADTTKPLTHEPVNLTAQILDAPENEDPTLEWSINGTQHEGEQIQHAFTTPGNHTVHLAASTPNATATDTLTLTVTDHHPPTPIITLHDEAPTTTEPTTLTASASKDPNGLPLTYAWALDDEPLGTDETIQVTLDAGVHTIHLTADNGHHDATTSKTLAVDEPYQAQDTLTLTDDLIQPITLHEHAQTIRTHLEHETTQGLETVHLALLDEQGDTLHSTQTDPSIGASTATATLTVDANELPPGTYFLHATLEEGIQAPTSLDGLTAYAPPQE